MRNHGLLGVLALLLFPPLLGAQTRQVTGRVTLSGTDQPIENAVVTVLAPGGASARTDATGRYTIAAPAGAATMRFRALGFSPRELAVPAGTSTLDVALTRDAFRLNEVVVTGQATTVERRSATTAVAYVPGDELTRVAAPTFENALTGKIAGVNIQSNSGAPGGGIQLQVRGNNTILGAYDPLYVVDGVIYSNERIAGGRGAITSAAFATAEDDAVNRVADLNPADIESIEILKGAAASSIYGSKAANGVVIITTRRGQAGRPRMNVVQRFGQFQPTRKLEQRRWTRAEVEAAIADDDFGPEVLHWFDGNDSPYYNHFDQIFRSSELSHETVADISGGTEGTRYFVQGGWKRDGGIEPNTGFTRGSLRANVDQRLGSRFDVQVTSVFNRSSHKRGWNNNCNNYACHGYAFPYTPSFVNYEKRDAGGNFLLPDWGIQSNPLQLVELAVNDEETYRFTGGVTLGYDVLRDDRQSLRLVTGGGIDAFQQNNDLWSPNELFHERTQALPGEAIEQNGLSRFYNWNANAVHTFNLQPGWSFTTSGGLQYEDRRLNVSRIRTQNLVPGQRNVDQGTNVTATEDLTAERTIALYAQEEVRMLDERLLLQAGLRAERSSVNGDIARYNMFPKVAASYRIGLPFAGVEIKPRIAYGETGNLPIFGQKFTNLGTPQLGGLQGFTVAGAAGSPSVEPERVREIEVGLDGSALDGGLTWELTGFNRNTTNLLLQRVPAPSTGFTSQIFNGGKIQNTGIEATLGYAVIRTADVQWLTGASFTRYRNEVLDLAGLPPFRPPLSGFGGLGVTFVQVGQPVTQIIGRGFCEDFPDETCASNGINTTRSDLKIGNTAPNFRMGFTNSLTYGDWSLSGVLDYQNGGSIINLTQFLYDDAESAADYGTPEYEARRRGLLNGVMTPYIEDATFLKLREVSIGYTLPARFITNALDWGVETVRLSVTGRNLHSWQKYSGLDPEVANLGSAAIRNNLDVAAYPPSRSFFINIAVGF